MMAKVRAFDPEAEQLARRIVGDIEFAENPYDAVNGADGLILITEWNEFRNLDLAKVASLMKQANMVDARNVYSPKEMKSLGFKYLGIGR